MDTLYHIKEKLQCLYKLVNHLTINKSYIPPHIYEKQLNEISCLISPKNFINDILKDKEYIYILLLEENKYYVGYSNNIIERLKAHFTGNGAEWTKKYKPIELIKIYRGDKNNEDIETLNLMKIHGDNVRGGRWCRTKLNSYDTLDINEELKKYS